MKINSPNISPQETRECTKAAIRYTIIEEINYYLMALKMRRKEIGVFLF